LRGVRKFAGNEISRIRKFIPPRRKGAKFGGEEQYSYELFSLFFPTFAALASLREIFRVSVAALPR
jgi:hypothetical protein